MSSGFNKFKTRTGRKDRVVHPDGSFRKGMRFTEGFLPSQTVKMLVNHRILNNGSYITPRNGIRGRSTFLKTVGKKPAPPAPHVVYYGLYRDVDGFDKKGKIILSFGLPESQDYDYYYTDPTKVDRSYYGLTFKNSGYAFGVLETDSREGDRQHILDTTGLKSCRSKFYKETPHPSYTIMNNYLYYLGKDDSGINKIYKVEINYNMVSRSYVVSSVEVEGREVSLGEATSIGFNMLYNDPFSFSNDEGIVLSTLGILPYGLDGSDHLKLSANLGDTVRFVMYYRYVLGANYRVRWEYAAFTSTAYDILHDYNDASYTNGSTVSLNIKALDPKFTLRCTIVPYVLETNEEGVQEEVLQEHLAKVAIYPVYTLGVQDIKDVSPVNYPLESAEHIAEHNEMLVLWGVPGLKNVLFFSDTLDAEYFPFPHNTYTFMDEILHVESFAGALFIFTSNTLYLLEGHSMYDMGYPRAVYDNLTFTHEDMFAVKAVKDGLFVRSKGKYYMFVPNIYTGQLGDVRLIPISDAIEELIMDPKSYLKLLSDKLYKFDVSWGESTRIREYDFYNYVDGSSVKNIHRFVVYEDKFDALGEKTGFVRYQLDAIFIYNTESFIWTTEVASFPFQGLAIQGNSLYSSHYREGGSSSDLYLEKMNYTDRSGKDNYNTVFYKTATNDVPTNARATQLASYPEVGFDTVVQVIDGDTVDLENLGRVRLLYIDAPESTFQKEPYGIDASNFLNSLIIPGSTVRFEFEGVRADAYDRGLVWLFTNEGDLIQDMIARMGFVKTIYDYGVSKYVPNIEESINQAIAERINLYDTLQPEGPFYVRNLQTASLLGNFQILDTGNCDHNSYMEKRYKEIQFLMSNDSSNVLRFYVEFYVDSRLRQSYIRYEIQHNKDTSSPDYGTIYVTAIEDPNITLVNETELGFWELDFSEFPSLDVVKVVFRVSGKGHYPRFVLVSRNEDSYKILNYSWVYRTMNAR